MQRKLARQFFYDMTLARQFEQTAGSSTRKGTMAGFLHLYRR
jgi:TPP-dependent pyruvate/acetoin dehydrogenase alpha subunit